MRKTLIMFLAVTFASAISVCAQSPIKFGLKAGANLTTLGTFNFNMLGSDNKEDYNYKPGFTAGIFSDVPIHEKFKLLAEVNYSQKGADVEGNVGGVKVVVEQRFNYLDVPLAFSYTLVPNLHAFVGPQFSFILSQTTKNTTYYPNGTQVDKNTSTDKMAKVIPAGVVGLSYEILSHVVLSGRYMSDLKKGSKDNDPRFAEARNSGLSLTVGYKF